MNKKGFTLMEIIAVVALLAILAVMITPNIIKRIQDSKVGTMAIQENSIVDAAKLYLEDYCFNPIYDYDKNICEKTSNINGENYLCLDTLEKADYIDAVKYDDADCVGVVVYKSVDGKLKNATTYIQCEKDNEIVYKSSDNDNFKLENFSINNYVCDNINHKYYTVKYYANGGTGDMKESAMIFDASNNKLKKSTFTKTGYDFVSWNTNPDGTGTKYKNEQIVGNLVSNPGDSISLYAQWEPKKYIVKFDTNGGEELAEKEIKLLAGSPYGNLPEPTKQDYRFDGWWYNEDKIENDSIFNYEKNITLKAKWIIDNLIYSDISNSYKCSNISAGSAPYMIEYSGECELIKENIDNWKLKLKSDGKLIVSYKTKVDIFAVGGGGGGSKGGGGGGYVNMKESETLIANKEYDVKIGEGGLGTISNESKGGTGGTTSFADIVSAEGGYGGDKGTLPLFGVGLGTLDGTGGAGGANGGNGAISSLLQNAASEPGDDGVFEFNDTNMNDRYSGGGGGAGNYTGANEDIKSGAGGLGGGGHAGDGTGCGTDGYNGQTNTGGGGGGGSYCKHIDSECIMTGGNGGSGIVIIRNTRK